MGLKKDLVAAKKAGLMAAGTPPQNINTKPGSPIDVEMTLMAAAIAKMLVLAEWRVTKFNAPVVMENFKIPAQPVDVKAKTLLGEYGPVLDTLRKIATPIPGGKEIIDQLEYSIERAVRPLLEGGSILRRVDLHKDVNGLEADGYVYIGEDPEIQDRFDVEDRFGQRIFTTVKLFPEDIVRLI